MAEHWGRALALSIGGVLGVQARYWVGLAIQRRVGGIFPWGTVVINVTGSFAIGALTMLLARWLPHPNVRLLVLTGFLGSYTTFSTFAYESVALWDRGRPALALVNLAGSVGAGLVAVVLGMAAANLATGRAAPPAPPPPPVDRPAAEGPDQPSPSATGR